jgi:hypothetical protein
MDASSPNITATAPQFADRVEAWGAAFLFGAFKVLPLDCASALGGVLARRIGPFLGVSKLARRNLRGAFPELSDDGIERVVTGMWDNLGRVAAEYPHVGKIAIFEPDEGAGFEPEPSELQRAANCARLSSDGSVIRRPIPPSRRQISRAQKSREIACGHPLRDLDRLASVEVVLPPYSEFHPLPDAGERGSASVKVSSAPRHRIVTCYRKVSSNN